MSGPPDFHVKGRPLSDPSASSRDIPEARSDPVPSKFRPDVEGLRAIAVVSVVLFHAEVPFLTGGFVGVDVFFVISGFLITGLLWREVSTAGTVGLAKFYGARARRLLPASALVGVVTAIASAILLPPLQVPTVMGDGIASALYVSNFRFMAQNTDYFFAHTTPSPFQHYWSLGVEEQFYLVWPAVIIGTAWLVRKRRRRNDADVTSRPRAYLVALTVVAVSSFALSLVGTYIAPTAAFFASPTRAWELAAGGIVALTATQWAKLPRPSAMFVGWTGLALILLGCFILQAATPFPGTAALLPVAGTALALGAGCAIPDRGAGRVLSLAPMRALGKVSYSWYLWHWPVLVLVPLLFGHSLGLAGRLILVVVSALLAVLTVRYVEDPLRFAAWVRGSAKRSLQLGAAATAVAVATGVVLLVAIPTPVGHGPAAPALAISTSSPRGPFAQVQAALAASVHLTEVPANLTPPLAAAAAEDKDMRDKMCLLLYTDVAQPECAAGDTSSPTTVALIGDSNAAMWNPALTQVAMERHWRLETMAKSGCPMLDLPITNRDLRRPYTECDQWRREISDRLQREPPALVVVGTYRLYGPEWGVPLYDQSWMDSITKLVRQLRANGSQVLVLGPTPNMQAVVPICLSGHLDDVAVCGAPRSKAINDAGIAAEKAATVAGGGRYGDVTELFCTAESCPPIVGSTLVYFDQEHLTSEYATALAPAIGALVDGVMGNSAHP
ncbi:acyltransferase family protein [Mycolicibacterium sp. Dal123E01]|uniref:acyltransferase family protein n=1 Tax=Mycolicibacterium sp. Dal123E01 TaxID=3457578 RepID=UPI00403E961B